MKPNPESTTFDRFRMVLGTLLAFAGAGIFIFSGVVLQFSSLPLTFAGALFVLSGVFIAGSHKLAEWLSGVLS